VFGEFFHIGGMDAYGMAHAILRGEAGSGGHLPENWRGLTNHNAKIVAFGDATARNRRMAGPNEWQIVNDVYRNGTKSGQGQIRYSVNLPDGGNPLVVFDVRSVNAKLCSAAGIRSLFIDPRCTELVSDLLVCAWDKTGTDIQKYGERGGSKLWQRTYLSDGLRDMIHQLFPMGIEARPIRFEDIMRTGGQFGPRRPTFDRSVVGTRCEENSPNRANWSSDHIQRKPSSRRCPNAALAEVAVNVGGFDGHVTPSLI